jgi:ring-1,2-phenylacetyl-CoA epoxidase subunit PaaA
VNSFEERFQQKIDNEEKIEARDWMPDAYRKTLDKANFSTRTF